MRTRRCSSGCRGILAPYRVDVLRQFVSPWRHARAVGNPVDARRLRDLHACGQPVPNRIGPSVKYGFGARRESHTAPLSAYRRSTCSSSEGRLKKEKHISTSVEISKWLKRFSSATCVGCIGGAAGAGLGNFRADAVRSQNARKPAPSFPNASPPYGSHARESGTSSQIPPCAIDCCEISPGRVISSAS
jgi:hypothetical protein